MAHHRRSLRSHEINLARNDLDFCYLPRVESSVPSHCSEFVCTVDCHRFFANGGDHIVFALDCEGAQGSLNPHCGPIDRRRKNLWAVARGFIIFGDGAVMAECWNGTAMPALANVLNTSGVRFNPVRDTVFTLRVVAGYRTGPFANRMQIEIFKGVRPWGDILFTGCAEGLQWGWRWAGSSRAAVGGIAAGFVPPSATGCVEDLVPRSAPNAVILMSRFKLRMHPPAAMDVRLR